MNAGEMMLTGEIKKISRRHERRRYPTGHRQKSPVSPAIFPALPFS